MGGPDRLGIDRIERAANERLTMGNLFSTGRKSSTEELRCWRAFVVDHDGFLCRCWSATISVPLQPLNLNITRVL